MPQSNAMEFTTIFYSKYKIITLTKRMCSYEAGFSQSYFDGLIPFKGVQKKIGRKTCFLPPPPLQHITFPYFPFSMHHFFGTNNFTCFSTQELPKTLFPGIPGTCFALLMICRESGTDLFTASSNLTTRWQVPQVYAKSALESVTPTLKSEF